jgi:hypothetical protein
MPMRRGSLSSARIIPFIRLGVTYHPLPRLSHDHPCYPIPHAERKQGAGVTILETALTLAAGGSAGGVGTFILQWRAAKQANRTADRTADTEIEEHRDGLTLDLLKAARSEMGELRKEMADQRMLSAKAAHIDEALDHIHALLHADGEIEFKAASRRAQAFLKRMRPDPVEVKGAERNDVQRAISASNIKRDASEETKP